MATGCSIGHVLAGSGMWN